MTSKLVYFTVDTDASEVWQAAQQIAADHGYIGQRGDGNVAMLLSGIASGEIATVMLAETPRDLVIDFLRSQAPAHPSLADALADIADALDEARQREIAQ